MLSRWCRDSSHRHDRHHDRWVTERNGGVSYDKLGPEIEGNFFTGRDGSAVGCCGSGATDENKPTAALMDDAGMFGKNGAIWDHDIA